MPRFVYFFVIVTESTYSMKKLEIYSSFDEMKNSTTTGTVSPAVLTERHKKFENFIHFIRGDEATEKSPDKNKTPKVK